MLPLQILRVQGNSMVPSIKQGSYAVMLKYVKIKEGDVVVAIVGSKPIIKRVKKIENNNYTLAGDNKEESTDSRNFGPVNKKEIQGKIVWVIQK